MSSAEIDTKRRSLGLSIQETAEVIGISERTLRYWFGDRGEPRDPADIMARLGEVEIAMGDLTDFLAERAHEKGEQSGDRRATILRYPSAAELVLSGEDRGLPLGAHAMAMSWLADDLRAAGFDVSFMWADRRDK